jgi:hypothetical protein
VTDLTSKKRWHAPATATVAALLVGLAACGDDPFDFDWSNTPGTRGTVRLYSLARPEMNLESGFSFAPPPSAAIVEQPNATGSWDFALDTHGGELVLLPPGALGITARSRIAVLGPLNFDEILEAPEDTLLYEDDQPVPVSDGTVYVVRTNRRLGSFGSTCEYHAKMQAVTIDVAGGTLVFRYVANPICNSRALEYRD